MIDALKSPFPWFGGKSTVATDVWQRFGQVRNYVDPFFGSGAMLLQRPTPFEGVETINDLDGFVANFWRAIQDDPCAVASYADWPVNEKDLEARHFWLITEGKKRLEGLGDPLWYDAQVAGWWVWGICSWIGSGWCSGSGPWQWDGSEWVGNAGQGINRKLPHLGDAGRGINRKLPHLGDAGRGINRQLPHLGAGRGINRQLPYLGGGDGGTGRGINRKTSPPLLEYFGQLSDRLRRVRVCSGDWSRVCGDSVTINHGLTAVFLDPPYSAEADRGDVYTIEDRAVAHAVREWALERGNNPLYRIALCGYEGEHEMPGWECWEWKAKGGFGSQGEGRGRVNAGRERIWFSPHCLKVTKQMGLFGGGK